MSGLDDRLSPDNAPFGADEPGWTTGCPAQDRSWVDAYGFRDFPGTLSNPVDCLPAGFPAYTAVLHALEAFDPDRRVKWLDAPGDDPWERVEYIVEHGLGSRRFAYDDPMSQPEGGILADVLGLDTEERPLTVTYFFSPWIGTVSAALLAHRLRTVDHDLAHVPNLWFPHSRAWVASSPYDAGWTYVASDLGLARRLLDDPRIEALACTYLQA